MLKADRKVIVDVEPLSAWACEGWFNSNCYYVDKKEHKFYAREQLEFVEYYGG